jgi:cytochrome c oxidase subunit 2
VFIVAGIVLLLILGGTIYMAAKYRDRGDAEFPEQLHGNTRLELGWTIVPAIILAVIAVFTVSELQKQNEYHRDKAMSVVVVGQQWWWEYRYYFDGFNPDKDYDPTIDPSIEPVRNRAGKTEKKADIITATQLVIPTGTEIDLTITARDVIHSFWIPALNGKRDAVPGRMSPWKIQADDPGVYFGQCTEFCGLSHSRMRMQVVALSAGDFETWKQQAEAPAVAPTGAAKAWLDQQKKVDAGAKIAPADQVAAPTATGAERGMATFRGQCSRCHEIIGINDDIYAGAQQRSGAAPNLTHFASRTTYAGGIFNLYNADGSLNRSQLEAWLRNPPEQKAMAPDVEEPEKSRGMPNLGLSEATIDDLVEFLQTLGPKPSLDTIQSTEVE